MKKSSHTTKLLALAFFLAGATSFRLTAQNPDPLPGRDGGSVYCVDLATTTTHFKKTITTNEGITFVAKRKKRMPNLMKSFHAAETGKLGESLPFSSAIDPRCNENHRSSVQRKSESTRRRTHAPDKDFHLRFNHNVNSGYFASNNTHPQADFDISFSGKPVRTGTSGHIPVILAGLPTEKGLTALEKKCYDKAYRMVIAKNETNKRLEFFRHANMSYPVEHKEVRLTGVLT